MVVGYNEGSLLQKCLESISFCDEIYYTDLGSTDNSIQIAEKFTSNILHRDRVLVPSCEMVQTEVVHLLKNDWVIFIDPDEVVDKVLEENIKFIFPELISKNNVGAVMVPWQFYFKKHKLIGTVWGGMNSKYFLVNRNRFLFEPIIHYGRKLSAGFTSITIPFSKKDNVLHHYWMNSYQVFIKKHLRYLKNEAQDQFNMGKKIGLKNAFSMPWKAFKESFFEKKGYKDGWIGFFLSVFWSYYQTRIAIGLLRIQNFK